MEAMSIESLLLSTWEEDGFVGKTRVPVAQSDVDALALKASEGKVRIGEAKVREGSQKVYVVDDSSLSWIGSQAHQDFAAWMEGDWAAWLHNLPALWDSEGHPTVPWLLPVAEVNEVHVVFCCNLIVLCDCNQANDTLRRAATRVLRENDAIAAKLDSGLQVSAQVKPTLDLITDLTAAVFARIHNGYGRRFGDPFKDFLRELRRYLRPALDRLPYDKGGERLGTRKKSFEEEIRKAAIMRLLKAMDIRESELQGWLVAPDQPEGSSP
jgi:hypothetical protein